MSQTLEADKKRVQKREAQLNRLKESKAAVTEITAVQKKLSQARNRLQLSEARSTGRRSRSERKRTHLKVLVGAMVIELIEEGGTKGEAWLSAFENIASRFYRDDHMATIDEWLNKVKNEQSQNDIEEGI